SNRKTSGVGCEPATSCFRSCRNLLLGRSDNLSRVFWCRRQDARRLSFSLFLGGVANRSNFIVQLLQTRLYLGQLLASFRACFLRFLHCFLNRSGTIAKHS